MLKQSAIEKAEDPTLSEECAVVDFGIEMYATSRVEFPPVVELLEGKAISVEPKRITYEHPDPMVQASEPELERLLSRYEEFQQSQTYLARVADLAAICGRLDSARDFTNQALHLNAKNANLKYRLGEIAFYDNDMNTAESIFKELAMGGHLLSSLRMAEAAISRASFSEADEWLHSAKLVDETDWRVQAFAGTLALFRRQADLAIRHFRSALGQRPRSTQLYYHSALAHVFRGNSLHALKELRRALGLDPFHKKALMALADLSLHERTGLENASRALLRFLSLNPDDNASLERLTYILIETGNKKDPQRLLAEALSRSESSIILHCLGVVALKSNNLPRAVDAFARSITLASNRNNSEDVRAVTSSTVHLVDSLLDLRRYGRAERVAEAFLSSTDSGWALIDDSASRIADALIRAKLNSNKMDQAISLAEQWIVRPTNPDLRTSLAETLVCYFTLKDVQLDKAYMYAHEAFELQRSLKPRNRARWNIALNNLAFTLIEMGRLDEAQRYLGWFRADLYDHGAYGYATRGLLAIRLGQIEKGEGLYRLAMSHADKGLKSSLRQKLNWELGRYWLKTGNVRKAKQYLGKVIKATTTGIWTVDYIKSDAKALLDGLYG